MFEAREILCAAGLPILFSAIVLLIAWAPWRDRGPIAGGFWGGPVALAGSFLIAFVGANRGPPQFPPKLVMDWLPFIAAGAAIVGFADASLQMPRSVRWLLGCTCIAAATWLVIRPLPAETHSLSAKLGWLVSRTIIWGGWWIAIDAHGRERPGASVPRDLLIVTAASALVLLMCGKMLGLLAGSLAVSLAVFLAVGLFTSASMARGGVLVLAALVSALLIVGLFYASLPPTHAVLLLVAVVLTAAGHFRPVSNLTGWKRHVVQVALVAVPAGVAVALSAAEFAKSMSESGSGYQY
jgi:hypothetical protein